MELKKGGRNRAAKHSFVREVASGKKRLIRRNGNELYVECFFFSFFYTLQLGHQLSQTDFYVFRFVNRRELRDATSKNNPVIKPTAISIKRKTRVIGSCESRVKL